MFERAWCHPSPKKHMALGAKAPASHLDGSAKCLTHSACLGACTLKHTLKSLEIRGKQPL